MSPRVVRRAAAVAAAVCAFTSAGCGGASSHASAIEPDAAQINSYLKQVEPLRLAVNRLLNTADPILQGLHDHRLSSRQAARRMGDLERRFAAYTVTVGAIEAPTAALQELQAEYAHTYLLEDAYLSALVSGIAEHHLDNLPNTQDTQRVAIIAWRTGLTILARRAGVTLPADIQQAGRGEIAPAPAGS